jgi:hypothetical protein
MAKRLTDPQLSALDFLLSCVHGAYDRGQHAITPFTRPNTLRALLAYGYAAYASDDIVITEAGRQAYATGVGLDALMPQCNPPRWFQATERAS